MSDHNLVPDNNKPSSNGITILKVFNYIGGGLVFFGIVFFIGMNWFSLNNFDKIFSTLGAAIAAYLVGTLLHHNRRHEAASSAFFLISALVIPVGLWVALDLYAQTYDILKESIVVSGACFVIFLLSQLFSARTIFLLFAVIYGSSFYFNLIDLILRNTSVIYPNLYEYKLIILGVSYIFLGRYLEFDKHYLLTGPLYFFGALYILSSSYSLGGFFISPSGISIWKLITALLIFLFFFLSVPLKSKTFLYLAAIFLTIYIIDMSFKFADILGSFAWPLLLVFGGFSFMVIGYLVFNLQKKIKTKRN